MPARPLFRITLLSLVWAALPAAHAAGMDCKRAATATEKAICADSSLVERDARMGDTYGELLAADTANAAREREAQRIWLQYRNKCGANTDCLRDAYDTRLSVLSTTLRAATAYKPDDVDRAAAEELRAAVDALAKAKSEFPIEHALRKFQIPVAGMTTFQNVEDPPDSDNPREFPKKRPKGVTEDEWRALVATDIVSEGENGNTSYTLLDLDGDGKRDVIIDDYIGGTGLFTYVSTRRREGGKFVGGTPMYSENGRGANQAGSLVRIRDRVYFAYRVGYYDEDTLYLLRAMKPVGQAPAVTVRYRYDLQVPKVQENVDGKQNAKTLDNTLHATLTKALPKVTVAQDRQPSSDRADPICPIPPGTNEDDKAAYYGMGPGHYSFEIVADFPVQIGGVCHLGRLTDWFGGYDEQDGLSAQYLVAKPGEQTDEPTSYIVTGKRTATEVTTTVKAVEGDNGI
jgi:uncharacterized protein